MHTSAEKAGLVLYSIMNFNTWLAVVSELIAGDPKYEQFATSWNRKAERLRMLNEVRVRLAHHTVWASDSKNWGLKPSELDTRSKAKKYSALTMDELRDFSEKEEKISNELYELFKAMRAVDQPEASPLAEYFGSLTGQPSSGSQ
tara:strand:- start:401 stop:835 length:435 start_codon:yes stop_codon:yes gene_type:complete